MKINSINTYFPIYKTLNQRNLGNKVQNDMFVKTEQVSFGKKKKSRADLINDFAKNVKKYYFEGQFDRKEIEKLIQKDVKDVSVKGFNEIDCDYPLPSDFMGVHSEEFLYDEDKQLVLSGKKTLHLKDPNDGEYTRTAYYANCVHEYTHLLQTTDPIDSEIACLNRSLKKSKASPEVKFRTVSLAPKFAIEVEKTIKQPIHNSLANPILLKKYLKKRPSVTEVYADNNINNIRKFATDIINEKVKLFAQKHGEVDEMVLKEFSLSHLRKENEAYQADYEAHRKIDPKISNSPLEWDKLAKVQLYRMLADLK